jgi:hypothetical protein
MVGRALSRWHKPRLFEFPPRLEISQRLFAVAA